MQDKMLVLPQLRESKCCIHNHCYFVHFNEPAASHSMCVFLNQPIGTSLKQAARTKTVAIKYDDAAVNMHCRMTGPLDTSSLRVRIDVTRWVSFLLRRFILHNIRTGKEKGGY